MLVGCNMPVHLHHYGCIREAEQTCDFEQTHAPRDAIARDGMAQIMNAISETSRRSRCIRQVVVDVSPVQRGAEAGSRRESQFLPCITRLAAVEPVPILMGKCRSDGVLRKGQSATAPRGFWLTESERPGQAIALECSLDSDCLSRPINIGPFEYKGFPIRTLGRFPSASTARAICDSLRTISAAPI